MVLATAQPAINFPGSSHKHIKYPLTLSQRSEVFFWPPWGWPQDVEYREKPSRAGDLSPYYLNGETEVLPSVLQLGSIELGCQALGFCVRLENVPRTGRVLCANLTLPAKGCDHI